MLQPDVSPGTPGFFRVDKMDEKDRSTLETAGSMKYIIP